MNQYSPFILGLDLGTNSVGWAIISLKGDQPSGIINCGVRVFDAGLDGDIESGNAEPRNAARRAARQARRQTDRRRRRKRRVFHLLQNAGLLPRGVVEQVIPELDRKILSSVLVRENITGSEERRKIAHLLPYWLRARALSDPLEPFELGRTLYHLAQRRGFLSNRKTDRSDSETGVVLKGISDLADEISASGQPTLGAYFSTLDPESERIRGRWTARSMYEREFSLIWETQQRFYPEILTEKLHDRLFDALSKQRPLKSTKDLIGRCTFETNARRAPWATLEAQEFRILQKILDTRILNHETGEYRQLTRDEQMALFAALSRVNSLTFGKAKKLLGLHRVEFNWESGGEKRFVGNTTAARIIGVVDERWGQWSDDEHAILVDDLLSIQKTETMVRRAREVWNLRRDTAQALSNLTLEPGYCALSRKALKRFLPELRAGVPYSTAAKNLYPGGLTANDPEEFLPSIQAALPEIRNPVVTRVLTELRKVVNSIIRIHGYPSVVRIELARDLKSSRKEKKRVIERNRANERIRERSRKRLLEEAGMHQPTRHDILKVQLAEECNWICPYTGKQISMGALVGPHSQFDVEHIIPFSKSFDNSFVNKTLCYSEENRSRKGNRTPFQAYAAEKERYQNILRRVRVFQGPVRMEKLNRFMLSSEDEIESFRSSQLSDTRYATIVATEFVGRLFGGTIDHRGRRRVFATKGSVSAILRRAWNLNSILSQDDRKTREDHRHHAVDAIAIALTTPTMIAKISKLSESRAPGCRLNFSSLPNPWDEFLNDSRTAIENIVVSHRPSRKVSGALHDETLYSPPKKHIDGKEYIHRRKAVHEIGKAVECIVDPVVREAVKRKLREVDGDPKKLVGESNLPMLRTGDGRSVPIRRVRIRIPKMPVEIGRGKTSRHVLSGGNHHLEVLAVIENGTETGWKGRMVTLMEAADRLRRKIDVVDRSAPDGMIFKFSLTRNDVIEIGPESPRAGLWRVQKLTKKGRGNIEIVMQRLEDARQVSKLSEAGRKWSPNTLKKDGARKLTVTPTGTLCRNRE